jgi:hypothetical protein
MPTASGYIVPRRENPWPLFPGNSLGPAGFLWDPGCGGSLKLLAVAPIVMAKCPHSSWEPGETSRKFRRYPASNALPRISQGFTPHARLSRQPPFGDLASGATRLETGERPCAKERFRSVELEPRWPGALGFGNATGPFEEAKGMVSAWKDIAIAGRALAGEILGNPCGACR